MTAISKSDRPGVANIDSQEYDLVSRHVLATKLVTELAPAGPVLDIGGAESLTKELLAGRSVVIADVVPGSVDVLADGSSLPFVSRSFAAAVALDVLEHVPRDVKLLLLDEAMRVADVVIVAGPFDDPSVEKAERHQRELFEAMFGRQHHWLREHELSGLPGLADTRERLEAGGFAVCEFGSNPLGLWGSQLLNSHVALRFGFDAQTAPVRRWLNGEFLWAGDGTPPSYRHFVVATRDARALAVVDKLRPASDEALVETAIRRTELSTAAIVNAGLTTLDELRQEMRLGWATSAEEVRRLERAAGEVADERTVVALERLVEETEAWRKPLAGPPIARPLTTDTMPSVEEYGEWLAKRRRPDPPRGGPRFSVIVPVFDPPAEYLAACIRSIRSQSYGEWELVLVDVSNSPHVGPMEARFTELDSRIRILKKSNKGIAENTNAGVQASSGEWIVFVDHDDVLDESALAAFAERIAAVPDADVVYSDEDKLDFDGRFVEPFLKPDWSPDLLRSVNYIAHLTAVRRSLFEDVGGLRRGFEGAQDYDFVLRATAAARRVEHVADILYHWRKHEFSTANDVRTKPGAHSAGRRALQDFLRSRQEDAWVEPGPGPTAHRVRYQLRPALTSIIIPFRDHSEVTSACLGALARSTPVLPIEVLLVSNQSRDPATFAAMEEWTSTWTWAKAVEFDELFNFQALNNWAAEIAQGELLLFLNNDTEALSHGWLESLAEHALRTEVGAVGGRLFYPDGSVQHAGAAVGIGGFAEHPWAHLHPDALTPAGPSYWPRNFLAVTAACMMVGHEKFDRVGGFNESFVVCGGDVDLCLRLHEAGLWNVMTPYARLVHHEATTRERTPPEADVRESLRAYAPYLAQGDPFYNTNLTLMNTKCELALR